MPRIAHTADIHIRSLSRHDEYRETFQRFIDDCRKSGVDHIFVGGDVFHTKTTGISPEYIDLLTWWLRGMSAVAPVHIILGNHDGNLVNSSRQDAVTPIVEALNDPRVHLYKKSGVYRIEDGFNFCVYSIFDEDGWSGVRPVPGDVNIACYHGPVWGCKTESDWEIEDGLKIDFFDGYDFTFLGDIHKRQFLAYRDDKPTMGYPGTLLQQNYAEELVHGYLLWNIRSFSDWSVDFRELPNEKPYVTLQWSSCVDDTLKIAQRFPRGSRFRIKSQTPVPQDDMHRLSELLKTSMLASEVTYKSDQRVDSQTVTAGSTTLVKSDLRSPDVLAKLMRDFHGDTKMQDADTDLAAAQIKSYLASGTSGDEVTRGSKWSLHQLRWDNMFVYGEDNVIDFDKLNGIVGIFGANRTGKSSIVGTLMYSLFNTTDRGPMKNIYVCNVRKPYCSSRAVISHDGTAYVIERQTTKSTNKRGQTSASTALNLYRVRDDGELDDLCGEQRADTEKTIRSLIGSAEDFLMTSLSAQGETNQFISQGSSRRRSILTRFLDLDIFDKMYDSANKDLNGLKSQLKNFPDRNWEELTTSNAEELSRLEESIKSLTHDLNDSQTRMSLLRSEMTRMDASPVTQRDVDSQRSKVESLQLKSDECASRISSLHGEIDDLRSKLTSIDAVVSQIDVEILRQKLDSQRRLETSIIELRHDLSREETLLKQQQKSLRILDEVPCGDDYPTCKFIKDAHELKAKLPQQTTKVNRTVAALEAAQLALDTVRDDSIEDKMTRHKKASDLSTKINLEISRKETEIERLRSTCDSCSGALEEARRHLTVLEEALGNDENEELVKVRSQLDALQRHVNSCDEKRTSVIDARGKIRARIEQLQEERKLRDELLERLRLQDLITGAFSKRGIPLVVTKNQLPLINAEVARILQGIVDFTIELENDEESDALEIYINYGDSRRIIELCSGMEKTVSSIALRVAMTNVTSLPRSDVFIIDEGFGTLDNSGIEACNRLLTSLKRYFRTIVVITHVDGIKDVADHVLEITRHEKDSKMEHA